MNLQCKKSGKEITNEYFTRCDATATAKLTKGEKSLSVLAPAYSILSNSMKSFTMESERSTRRMRLAGETKGRQSIQISSIEMLTKFIRYDSPCACLKYDMICS
jgi:hypothetical protein